MDYINAFLVLVGVYVYLAACATLATYKNYKYYKITYNALVNYDYVFSFSSAGLNYYVKRNRNIDEVLERFHIYNDPVIIYFLNSNSVKLLTDVNKTLLLNDSALTYITPYDIYYRYKFKKWFKNNSEVIDYESAHRNKKIEDILA